MNVWIEAVLKPVAAVFIGWIAFVFALAWAVVRLAEWRARSMEVDRISQGFEERS